MVISRIRVKLIYAFIVLAIFAIFFLLSGKRKKEIDFSVVDTLSQRTKIKICNLSCLLDTHLANEKGEERVIYHYISKDGGINSVPEGINSKCLEYFKNLPGLSVDYALSIEKINYFQNGFCFIKMNSDKSVSLIWYEASFYYNILSFFH